MFKQKQSGRGDTTERLIRIPILLAERPYSQQELAQEFGVDTVTIRRNIGHLSCYYPIIDEKRGREVYYSFSGGYKYKAPSFTPAELAILLLAQESIVATGLTAFGTPFASYGRTLLAKVRAALPQTLRDKLDALSSIFGSSAVPAKDYSPHAETIDRLTTAAVECYRVVLRYHTLGTDTISNRLYEPYVLYFDPDGATLKLIGYDHERKEIIPLSIDRIRGVKETKERFTRPNFDLHNFLTKNCFNGIHGEPITVRLRAFGVTARIFAERCFHPSQRQIEYVKPNRGGEESITIEMCVARGRGLERFILSWSPDVEVLDPPELRKRIAELHYQSLQHIGKKE
ncbi:MAG: WYL domain-containing protein [Acidobacteriota bacterium]